jgi:hypothetical protein
MGRVSDRFDDATHQRNYPWTSSQFYFMSRRFYDLMPPTQLALTEPRFDFIARIQSNYADFKVKYHIDQDLMASD